jgi:hypothetical protein
MIILFKINIKKNEIQAQPIWLFKFEIESNEHKQNKNENLNEMINKVKIFN